MPNWNYTHGSTSNRNRLRFLLGDHRGTNGVWTGTNQIFSDEELDDILLVVNNNLVHAARVCVQCRISREAMAAGVSGTTDTTDRPQALIAAVRGLNELDYPGSQSLPKTVVTADSNLDRKDLET